MQLGFGLARAALAQVDEAQVGVPERLLGSECHDLVKLRFGAWQLLLLQVGQAPGPGRERRVAPRLVRAGRRSPACRHQQQPDAAQVSRFHAREDDESAARRQVY